MTVFVVSMSLGVSLLEADPASWSLGLQGAGLALIYILLAIGPGERLDGAGPMAKTAYFVLQLGVLALVSWVFVEHRLFGVVWLFHMPMVSQSRIFLPPAGTAIVCLAGLGVLSAHVWTIAGWDDVPGSLFGISTAFAFVLVFTDIATRESNARADSQRLGAELEAANNRLGEYAVQAEELATARERTRMAREIHDSVGHSLTAVHMQIEAARTMLDRDPEKTRAALDKAQRSIQEGLSEIRRSVSALRSDPLDGRDLHGALVDLAELSSSSGLPVRFRVTGRQRPISQAAALAVFRCAQEGLTNAKKHARARNVELELDYGENGEAGRDENHLRLRVADDGVGLDALGDDATESGFGLLGLRERVRQLDGDLEVVSKSGEGLTLRVEIPTSLAGS